jgi:hypothetical protein
MDVGNLYTEVEKLLKDAGFPPEVYIVIQEEDCVSVHFDNKEAVDYFRGDFDNWKYAVDCMFEYKRVGKRHAAFIHNW